MPSKWKPYRIYLEIPGSFKAGDPPPPGYCDWHDWAEVQTKAGLTQRKCWECGLLRFPQEVCHGPEPANLHSASLTVGDIISGKKTIGPKKVRRAR